MPNQGIVRSGTCQVKHASKQASVVPSQHVVAGGDVAPLVGHNAFLRWAAVEECAFEDAADGKLKYWSESHVSEDFDMSVRLQIRGYIGRYISYTGTGIAHAKFVCDLSSWNCLEQAK